MPGVGVRASASCGGVRDEAGLPKPGGALVAGRDVARSHALRLGDDPDPPTRTPKPCAGPAPPGSAVVAPVHSLTSGMHPGADNGVPGRRCGCTSQPLIAAPAVPLGRAASCSGALSQPDVLLRSRLLFGDCNFGCLHHHRMPCQDPCTRTMSIQAGCRRQVKN